MLKHLGSIFALYYSHFCSACKECHILTMEIWKQQQKMPLMLNLFLLCKAWIELFSHYFKKFWMLWILCPIQYTSFFFMYWKICVLLVQLVPWKRNAIHWFDWLLHIFEMFPQHCRLLCERPFHMLHILITCIVTVKCEEKICIKNSFQKNVEWKRKELENKVGPGTFTAYSETHIHGSFDGIVMQIYYWNLQLAVKCSQKNK